MAFELPALPYPKGALAPHMSAETLELHHDGHHRAYVDALNDLVKDTSLANRSLEEIIRATAKNAAKRPSSTMLRRRGTTNSSSARCAPMAVASLPAT
jgi:superoxide dismutase